MTEPVTTEALRIKGAAGSDSDGGISCSVCDSQVKYLQISFAKSFSIGKWGWDRRGIFDLRNGLTKTISREAFMKATQITLMWMKLSSATDRVLLVVLL